MMGPKPSYSFALLSTLWLTTLYFGHIIQVHTENTCLNILYLYFAPLSTEILRTVGRLLLTSATEEALLASERSISQSVFRTNY